MPDAKTIRCLPAPPAQGDPYPAGPVTVESVTVDRALVLLRLADERALETATTARFILKRRYTVGWSGNGVDAEITVPAGLITDLTSVPTVLRWYVGRVGPWLEAAVVHDYLYIAWQTLPHKVPTDADRKFADDLMLEMMKDAGVDLVRRTLIHLAVRWFGGWAFFQPSPQNDLFTERYVDLEDPALRAQIETV